MSARRVNQIGQISHEGNRVFLSMALAGWDVGLHARGDGTLEVHFARLALGLLGPASAAFLPATPHPPPPEAI